VEKLARMLERKPHLVDGDGGLGDHAGGAGGDGGLSAQVSGGLGPLHYAAREGRVECAALLIKLGADVNRATAAGGATPLHRAAYTARTGCVGSRVRRVLGGGGLGFRVYGVWFSTLNNDASRPRSKSAPRGVRRGAWVPI
jgi:ankyrin repeat protein